MPGASWLSPSKGDRSVESAARLTFLVFLATLRLVSLRVQRVRAPNFAWARKNLPQGSTRCGSPQDRRGKTPTLLLRTLRKPLSQEPTTAPGRQKYSLLRDSGPRCIYGRFNGNAGAGKSLVALNRIRRAGGTSLASLGTHETLEDDRVLPSTQRTTEGRVLFE